MKHEDDPFGVRSVAASGVVSSALIAALVQKLGEKGLLSDLDVREIYDGALYSLERSRASAEPQDETMFREAAEIIERALSETPLPDAES
ncbi:hypothetical protein [uncultured Roseobacter sp.]|uniref:hypothetical protein n=1 Tax=uncultured Roseobacter sp. TaxID=114847 RepID=UPI00261E904C|nr:hypothetical protein [uncultured Roseobacter sp.]